MTVAVRHDALFKNLIKTFLPDLLHLVLPELIPDLQLSTLSWIDKESFVDPLQGRHVVFDLLARIRHVQPIPRALLVHVEIEAQFRTAMDARMHAYYHHLRLRHQQPTLCIVLYLRGGPPGVHSRNPRDTVGKVELYSFHYWTFSLARCTAEDYLHRPQPLAWALAALMRPRMLSRLQLRIECLRKIARCNLDKARQALLVNVVVTYLRLSADEEEAYMELLQHEVNTEVKDLELTWFDQIEAKGHQRGLVDGTRAVLRMQLAEKFGPLPRLAERRLEAMEDLDLLHQLSRRLLHASSLTELGLS